MGLAKELKEERKDIEVKSDTNDEDEEVEEEINVNSKSKSKSKPLKHGQRKENSNMKGKKRRRAIIDSEDDEIEDERKIKDKGKEEEEGKDGEETANKKIKNEDDLNNFGPVSHQEDKNSKGDKEKQINDLDKEIATLELLLEKMKREIEDNGIFDSDVSESEVHTRKQEKVDRKLKDYG